MPSMGHGKVSVLKNTFYLKSSMILLGNKWLVPRSRQRQYSGPAGGREKVVR